MYYKIHYQKKKKKEPIRPRAFTLKSPSPFKFMQLIITIKNKLWYVPGIFLSSLPLKSHNNLPFYTVKKLKDREENKVMSTHGGAVI